MSRRHQGGRSHRSNGHGRRPGTPLAAPPTDLNRARADAPPQPIRENDHPAESDAAELLPSTAPTPAVGGPSVPPTAQSAAVVAIVEVPAAAGDPAHRNGSPPAPTPGCTVPQLRRFIKSRPYVPMHELRRRFGINGAEDDVTPVDVHGGKVFVGLPPREGSLLGELLRGGEVGYELSLDPRSPIVVGLYPMRPIPRS